MSTRIKERNRIKILEAAEKVLKQIGRDDLSIRRVAEEANVQAPTIYRIFDDKQGLLDALAEAGFTRYMQTELPTTDSSNPIEELRIGWDFHVRFGLENPDLYDIMYDRGYSNQLTPAAKIAHEGFSDLIQKLSDTHCLRVSKEEAMFTAFVSAAGTVRALLSLPRLKDVEQYRVNIRETMISAITK